MGFAMTKDDNIYVKLVLDVHFDRNAPNFHVDDTKISWCPTPEEISFITESVQKIAAHQWTPTTATGTQQGFAYKNTTNTPPTKPTQTNYTAPTQPTATTPTPTKTTSAYTATPTPTPTTSTSTATEATSTTAAKTTTSPSAGTSSGMKDTTMDILLKRKKDEKDQKVAYVP